MNDDDDDDYMNLMQLQLDFSGFIDDTIATPPVLGSAKLVIIDKCEPLFYSATWSIVATVGTLEIGKSTPKDHHHDQHVMKLWARRLIKANKEHLKALGVDTDKTYVEWGGDINDFDY